jgi:DNA-binding transcriptional MerR regulator
MFAKYSIRDLEKLSGIKAHTLRIWEQRYNLLSPERTDTNIRWYSNEELKMLLNISMLYHRGYKISKIAALKKEEIIEEVNKLTESQNTFENQIDSLVICMVELDENKFEKIISNTILRLGFASAIEQVIYPFLKKIGVLWQTGSINPAQEHFISNLIRQKIIVAIDGIVPAENKNAKKIVLFLPENELHELSLLYYSYLLKSKGHNITYLGQSVPYKDLQKVYEIRQPEIMLTIFTQAPKNIEKYVQQLAADFSQIKLMLSGAQIVDATIALPSNVVIFRDAKALLEKL